MNVEIAICTWNRAELLGGTLASISRLVLPADVSLRVIVVNNGSTDDTDSVARSFSKSLDLQIEHEPQQGHTFARNRAIAVAAGQLLIWTDDDVVVDPHWVAAYANAARHSQFDFWGGKILPSFLPQQPAWIAENWESLRGCFAFRDLGDVEVEFEPNRLPYGANFAIRTELQKRFPFNVRLGRRGPQVVGEDEIDMLQRVCSAGHRGQWVPASRLQHVITAERASFEYVHDYFVGQGRRIFQDGSGWSTNANRLWWQWRWQAFLFWLTRRYAKSPAYVAHLIRSGLAEGQYRAAIAANAMKSQ